MINFTQKKTHPKFCLPSDVKFSLPTHVKNCLPTDVKKSLPSDGKITLPRTIYAQKLNDLIDKGDVNGLLKTTEPYKNWKAHSGILNFHTYVESHKQCMNYPDYEAKGYFVGSGAIESCHRYTMQNRMKQPGQRWNVETGQGILSLKSRYESGNWNEVAELCRLDYLGLHRGTGE